MMTLHNPKGFDISKYNDQLIVDHYLKLGKTCSISEIGSSADIDDKIDIIIDGHSIDTKYFRNFTIEVDKIRKSKAEYIWYILKNTDHKKTVLVRTSALIQLSDDINGDSTLQYRIGPSGNRLADFTLDMLKENKDYYIYDLSMLELK